MICASGSFAGARWCSFVSVSKLSPAHSGSAGPALSILARRGARSWRVKGETKASAMPNSEDCPRSLRAKDVGATSHTGRREMLTSSTVSIMVILGSYNTPANQAHAATTSVADVRQARAALAEIVGLVENMRSTTPKGEGWVAPSTRFANEVAKPLKGLADVADELGDGFDEAFEVLEALELAGKELNQNVFATATRYSAEKNDRPALFMKEALDGLDKLLALVP